jgi:hypothetical protein
VQLTEYDDIRATLALAKGAALKLLLLQQQIMMTTAGDAINGTMRTFAREIATDLRARVAYHLDENRLQNAIRTINHDNEAPFRRTTINYPAGKCRCAPNPGGTAVAFHTFKDDDRFITLDHTVRTACYNEGHKVTHKCAQRLNHVANGRYVWLPSQNPNYKKLGDGMHACGYDYVVGAGGAGVCSWGAEERRRVGWVSVWGAEGE